MQQDEFIRSGLTSEQVKESRAKHGANILSPPKRNPWWKLLLQKFDDPIIRILIIAAFIAVIVGFFQGNFIEGIGIIVAVLLATLLAFFNEYRAGLEFDVLNQVSDTYPVSVARNGVMTTIPISEVVVGDHVIIDTGEEIPADGKIFACISLGVNESSLTGEPLVYKTSHPDSTNEEEHTYPPNMLYRGTTVMEGTAMFVVTAVGNDTEIGKTAREAAIQIDEPTPLARQLDKLSTLIGVVGFTTAFVAFWSMLLIDFFTGKLVLTPINWFSLFAVLLPVAIVLTRVWLPVFYDLLRLFGKSIEDPRILKISFLSATPRLVVGSIALFAIMYGIGCALGINLFSQEAWFTMQAMEQILLFILVAITLIVVVVPEGLAMSVTLSLAYSMRKMTATNNLVRKMQATETMGATTVICTDKTGTLTQNRMQVVEASFFEEVSSLSSEKEQLVGLSMAVNSKAFLEVSELVKPIGNPTDAALLLWLHSLGKDYNRFRNSFNIIDQIPFSSETKYMATLGYCSVLQKNILLLKGAPEIVNDLCGYFHDTGEVKSIGEMTSEQFSEGVASLQQSAHRTLAFSYKILDNQETSISDELIQQMVLLGYVGIADPIREDVPNAIQQCHHAGVDIKVITGDIRDTALEIGKQIGLCQNLQSDVLISGTEFSKMDDEQAMAVIPNLRVMYRARPSDKLKLVRLLQAMGEVVAVTGDGTNDAPALNRANVGLAMGSGTSVAKEASDIILLDDSFASIVNAIRWGRSLYQNIQRFLVFQLSINLLALGIVLFGPLVGVTLPLTVVQMLWVNLIMDTLAAVALATEPPNDAVLNHKPRNPNSFIITPPMQFRIAFVAVVFFVILMGMLHYLSSSGKMELPQLTLFFNAFVLLQFWNLFNVKAMDTERFVFSNLAQSKNFLLVAGFILIGQIIIVQFGGDFFRTEPLRLEQWLLTFAGTSLVLWVGELYRLLKRAHKRRSLE